MKDAGTGAESMVRKAGTAGVLGGARGREDVHEKGMVAPDEVASGGGSISGVGEKFKLVGAAMLQLVERHEALLVESQHQQRAIQRLEGSVVNLRKGQHFVSFGPVSFMQKQSFLYS